MTEHMDQPAAATTAKGSGTMLREAREARRITLEDAAKKLHLSVKQITALEQDDFKSLPGPTYVRGYLRSYSQLLGLPAEKVLEPYNKIMAPPEPIAPPVSAPPPQVTSNDQIVKAATVLVVVVVVSLVIVWWRGQGDEASPKTERSAASLEQSLAPESSGRDGAMERYVPPPPIIGTGAATTPSGTVVTDGVLAPKADERTDAATVDEKSKPVQAQPAPGQPAVSSAAPNASPAESPKPPVVRVDRAMARAKQETAQTPSASRSRLVLHAAQESWADIRDAKENKLLYETVPAGRSLSIEGLAPFSVFIGNAGGVKLEFNGKAFDINQHKRGQVARFTLGDKADVKN